MLRGTLLYLSEQPQLKALVRSALHSARHGTQVDGMLVKGKGA